SKVNVGDHGAYWTDALAAAILAAGAGANVQSIINTANGNDSRGQSGTGKEHPQSVSSGGGSGVTLGPGQAVGFSRLNTDVTCTNDVNNMGIALGNELGTSNVQLSSPTSANNTQASLQTMLNTAAGAITPGQELIIYIGDHGNTEFNFNEFLNSPLFSITPT